MEIEFSLPPIASVCREPTFRGTGPSSGGWEEHHQVPHSDQAPLMAYLCSFRSSAAECPIDMLSPTSLACGCQSAVIAGFHQESEAGINERSTT